METVTLLIILFLYILGVYFFFIKKNHMGTASVPIRIFCFIISPIMVTGLVYEIVEDWVRKVPNRRTQ